MKKRLQDILHKYKVEAFKVAHDHERLGEITKECLTYGEDTVQNAFHYHFHKLPDANRAEIINMINNYTLEALLPPVVEKILKRIVILEKQHRALLKAIEEVCEEISDVEPAARSSQSKKS
jgi:hypothetical protein